MKRLKSLLFATAVAVVLAGGASARADISWSADWSGPSTITTPAGSQISVTNYTNDNEKSASGLAVPVNIANGTITKFATGTDTFSNMPYTFTLKLTEGNQTQTLSFTGSLSGQIGSSQVVTNSFGSNPMQSSAAFADGTVITVDFNGYLPIKPPGTGTNVQGEGGWGVDITAVAGTPGGGGSGSPHGTPEPSTLALGGLGMVFTSLMAWRRRNRNAAFAG